MKMFIVFLSSINPVININIIDDMNVLTQFAQMFENGTQRYFHVA